ncbi:MULTISPECIES: pyridoxamine 5'-phosphate oxidase family protein [unclassified Streptomyces]|uniref:pyridoxamine 5'-phosphate oxidase family protein n=1 Tax=unclassified Streptomyces TaxID=2593676 RepID=UPI002E285C6E|nr:pyridoxamine 5'-phosphate oxidase family protein [Streptomyces sp. NBC_01439]
MENRPVGSAAVAPAGPTPRRRTEEIGTEEALRLLGTVGLGRIVFTRHALPAVRPVNHLLDDGDIIVRVQDGSTLAALLTAPDSPDVVVAYEADAIDPDTRLGWSVVATGYASAVTDPTELNHYAQRLKSWADAPPSGAVRIRPGVVTGFRLRAVNS